MPRTRQDVVRAIARVPGIRHPRVLRAVVDSRRTALRTRRLLAERLGRRRLSRPALHDLDRQLEALMPFDGGYFVEAGGFDGYEQSNTYYLERFKGWRGVLVEPMPVLFRRCARERPGATVFNRALIASDDPRSQVEMHYGGLVSTVNGAFADEVADLAHATTGDMGGWDELYDVTVPTATLTQLLVAAGAPRDFDLLSLDVEGYEIPVLRGLDLDQHAPRYALIEMRDMEAQRPAIEAVLGDRYEAVGQLSPYDMLYRRADVDGYP